MGHDIPTIILRHRKERLAKCSLRGLEERDDLHFFKFPNESPGDLSGYVILGLDGEPLSPADASVGLCLVDGTWRYAQRMLNHLIRNQSGLAYRTLPRGFHTAYPRRQSHCPEPEAGLASVEALFIAFHILGKSTTGLLDNYHWRDEFLELNPSLVSFPPEAP